MITCNRCKGEGFLNLHQIPEDDLNKIDGDLDKVLIWIREQKQAHDVMVCDCCGDGEGWHGEVGKHYGPHDLPGRDGPYSYNGGLCECH